MINSLQNSNNLQAITSKSVDIRENNWKYKKDLKQHNDSFKTIGNLNRNGRQRETSSLELRTKKN